MAASCCAAGARKDAGQPIAGPRIAMGKNDSTAAVINRTPSKTRCDVSRLVEPGVKAGAEV